MHSIKGRPIPPSRTEYRGGRKRIATWCRLITTPRPIIGPSSYYCLALLLSFPLHMLSFCLVTPSLKLSISDPLPPPSDLRILLLDLTWRPRNILFKAAPATKRRFLIPSSSTNQPFSNGGGLSARDVTTQGCQLRRGAPGTQRCAGLPPLTADKLSSVAGRWLLFAAVCRLQTQVAGTMS